MTLSRASTLALCILLATSVASAQDARKESQVDTVVVRSVDPDAKTLTVGEAEAVRRYAIDTKTVIRSGSEEIPLSSLETGDRVAVSATMEGTTAQGDPIANTIQVVQHAATSPDELRASLRDPRGDPVGDVTLRDTPNGVLIHAKLRNLPPGEHGFHVHETGSCTPSFAAAGGHLAPEGSSHGYLVAQGPHPGDLPNLVVPSDGSVEKEVFAADLRFDELRDADGAALIVHAKPDDYRSQPSGAAGDRIACGVIGVGDATARR